MSAKEPIVVVGAGHAGFQLASSLRQSGCEEPIALVNDEPFLPYQRPPLSKAFLKGGGDPDTVLFRPATFFRDQRIELLDEHVDSIDRSTRRAVFRSGRSIGYAHLVLATGARNRLLQLPYADNEGILYLRSLADSDAVRKLLGEARRVVVIGAGFIGLEFAATAAEKGLEVDVVEMAPRIMARVVSPLISEYFLARHEAAGCRIHCGRFVQSIETSNGRMKGVMLDDGARLAADFVVVGIGVVPNVELAMTAGLPAQHGIVVDEFLSTPDPCISAIGDCALFSSRRHAAPVRLECVANATDQARCLAARLTGNPAPFDSVPWFWSNQGADKLQIAGFIDHVDDAVVRGGPDQHSFSVFCYDDGRLLCVESVNRVGDHMAARRILAAGADVRPELAIDPSFDLKNVI